VKIKKINFYGCFWWLLQGAEVTLVPKLVAFGIGNRPLVVAVDLNIG